MAKGGKKKEKAKGNTGGSRFNISRGGTTDEIKKEFKSGNTGPVLRIGENEEYTVAILADPSDWGRILEYNISAPNNSWAYIPDFEDCLVRTYLPNERPRPVAFVPMYIYDNKRVQYFRAPSTVVTDLAILYDRYGEDGFLDYDWILTRIDSDGPVRYDLDRQMNKVKKSIKRKINEVPDLEEVLEQRYQQGIENMGWSDKKSDRQAASRDKKQKYDEGNDDIDIDDIVEMDKEELLELIDDYSLKVEEPEEIKLKPLRKIVTKLMKKKLK